MESKLMETYKIKKLNNTTDIEKYESLLKEVRANGWKNVPAIVVIENDYGYYAVTGSHRYAVAEELEIDIPVDLYTEDEINYILERDDIDERGIEIIEEI
jgi:ParB-like chromosome segregation protein Spo0J